MESLWTTQEIDKRVGDNYETMPCVPWNSIICITSCLSLFLTGHLVGIGVGTILAMLGVGWVG